MVKSSTVALGIVAVAATAGLAFALSTKAAPPPPPNAFKVKVVDSVTGAAIPGASVTYNNQTKASDSSGLVSFSAVTGFTPLAVTASGYQDLLEPNFQAVTGGQYIAAMISLSSANVIIEADSFTTLRPLPGASISLDSKSGTADANGQVPFNGLSPGTYTVKASLTGYTSATQQILVQPGGGAFRIYLTPVGGALTATVVSPASGATFPAGQTVTFQGAAAGGTPPYSFAWYFPDNLVLSGQTVSRTFSTPLGEWIIYLKVTDATGALVDAIVIIYVQ